MVDYGGVSAEHKRSLEAGLTRTQIFGSCHSTGLGAYGALSYAMAIVATSAKSARKTTSFLILSQTA
jgi:hypothetical protein